MKRRPEIPPVHELSSSLEFGVVVPIPMLPVLVTSSLHKPHVVIHTDEVVGKYIPAVPPETL